MLTEIDKNRDGKIDFEEAEEAVEEVGSCLGSGLFCWLFESFFGCLFKKREPDKHV